MTQSVSIPERAREIAAKWINENNVLYIPLGSLMKLATEALRSERELCLREAEDVPGLDGSDEDSYGFQLGKIAILKKLREGGK